MGQPDGCAINSSHYHGKFDKSRESQVDEDKLRKQGNVCLVGDCYTPLISQRHCELGRDTQTDNVWIRDLDVSHICKFLAHFNIRIICLSIEQTWNICQW